MRGRINPVARYKVRRFLGLGQQIDPASGLPMIELDAGSYGPAHPGLPNPVVSGGIATGLVALENAGNNWFTSTFGQGATVSGIPYAAITGNVSPSQKQSLIDQQTAAMIRAGADP